MIRDQPFKYSLSLIFVIAFITSLLLTACNGEPQSRKNFTICVANYHPGLAPVFDGLKAGLTELGYIEGKNITFIYNGVVGPNAEAVKAEIENLVTHEPDLLFTMGTEPALQARQAVEGTDIPVVFAPVINPVDEGIVESIRLPGGNLTGVQNGNAIPKSLEWMRKILPDSGKIYVPYKSEDAVSRTTLKSLREAAEGLGIELMVDEVRVAGDVVAAIETLPENVKVVYLLPGPSLEQLVSSGFPEAATERGIAIASYTAVHIEAGALFVYAVDQFSLGKQSARLVDQVLQGTKPADLPVETAEFFLTLNLERAEAIGLHIQDEILRQANTVIRQ